MKGTVFKISLAAIGLAFAAIFCVLVIPPLIENPDIMGAAASGFVNPYASGYASDAICCWLVLLVWVVYEYPKVKYGWVCVLLGMVPGVATGLAAYLLLRMNQLK